MKSNEISISCYENEVPPFVESEIEQLYGNIFSSLLEFRVYGWAAGTTSTYVVSCDGRIRALLLFKRESGRVRVLNEAIRIGQDEVKRFADFIFARYPDVDVISFKAIETNVAAMPFPCQRFNHLEDITLTLPATTEDYLASLGKNTRRNIKRYGDRLVRNFPTVRFEVREREQVDEHQVRAMIEFNHARMEDKGIVSVIDEQETRRIVELAKACGLVGSITIDGRLVAGAISYRAGSNYFLNVLAHDPQYDDYWVGFLCCYQTIRECIVRGGREFHFLWGRYDYKFVLGAVRRDLDNVTLYRSWLQLALNADVAWREAASGYLRQLKIWVKYEDTYLSQRARKLFEWTREMKRNLASMMRGRRPAFPRSTADR
jgi:hypothetical protein